MSLRVVAATLWALGLAGCQRADDPSHLYDTSQLRDAARAGTMVSGLPATQFVVPRGGLIPWLSPPYGPLAVIQRGDLDGLVLAPAFCEGKPAAYVTTELWYRYAPVWLQPLYLLATAYNATSPGAAILKGAKPIFSVGADSSFYSPYWQVYWVVVPPDTAPDAITTTQQILDGHYPIHQGPNKLCPIVPGDVAIAQSSDEVVSRPFDGAPVGPVKKVQVYADGQLVTALDFGNNRITADATGVVQETPIFTFVIRKDQGSDQNGDESGQDDDEDDALSLGLPTVAGVGPFRSGQPFAAPNNVPAFGAYWRLYYVTFPKGAGVFVPPSDFELIAQLTASGASVPPIDPAVAARPDVGDYLMRVALDPSCFSDPTRFPDDCRWLDSQAAIEGLLSPALVTSTDYTLDCPLVTLNGQAVPNP